ncbi:replication protein A 14 kDa subunit [Tachyglossus aculeatus]|uniref:replication protein A 14 kDa subunit n=1 Tax=Tachyglossus aculeatus TaxID=9261 RepID=UPI0018F42560|nr:replication protein A 14 kDa subunit [Tachyglossus aculeatus]
MGEAAEASRPRVGSGLLPSFVERHVCFVGRLDKIHPNGKSFVLSDGEGKNATIELLEPLSEELSGVVEVVGRVTAKGTILCSTFIPFREDNGRFDLGLYNEAVKIIHDFPQYFPFGVAEHE